MAELTFRNAVLDDAERILEIYRYYVEKTAITFEWTVPLVKEFRERMKRTMEKFPYIVALKNEKIIGYSYASAFNGRKAYEWSVEMTIYLDFNERGFGYGKQLYLAMEKILKKMNILNLNACIAYPKQEDEFLTKNSAVFHEHLGYDLAGRFHDSGYKFKKWYDMIWMEKLIGNHLENPENVLNYNQIKNQLANILS